MISAQNYSEYRKLIVKAEDSEKAAKAYLAMAEKDFSETNKPIFQSYIAVGNFFMAKHAFNPIKKMSHFNIGKKMMNEAVFKNPNDIEIRFLRLISQEKMPKILGYYQDIPMDKNFLITQYKKSNDEELVAQIKKHLNIK